jgi:hypothetical protein
MGVEEGVTLYSGGSTLHSRSKGTIHQDGFCAVLRDFRGSASLLLGCGEAVERIRRVQTRRADECALRKRKRLATSHNHLPPRTS